MVSEIVGNTMLANIRMGASESVSSFSNGIVNRFGEEFLSAQKIMNFNYGDSDRTVTGLRMRGTQDDDGDYKFTIRPLEMQGWW